MQSGARVRLEGIDTPETVRENYPVEPWGPEASAFTKDFIKRAGYNVKLSFGNERLDDYGRYLAFVWDGDKMLNEELVRAGLAEARLGWHFSSALKRRLPAISVFFSNLLRPFVLLPENCFLWHNECRV